MNAKSGLWEYRIFVPLRTCSDRNVHCTASGILEIVHCFKFTVAKARGIDDSIPLYVATLYCIKVRTQFPYTLRYPNILQKSTFLRSMLAQAIGIDNLNTNLTKSSPNYNGLCAVIPAEEGFPPAKRLDLLSATAHLPSLNLAIRVVIKLDTVLYTESSPVRVTLWISLPSSSVAWRYHDTLNGPFG